MRIYKKLIIAFLAISIIPALGFGAVFFYSVQKSIEKTIFYNLNAAASEGIDKLDSFIALRKSDLILLNQRDIFKRLIPIIDKFIDDKQNPDYVEAVKTITEQFIKIQTAYQYSDILIFNKKGDVIYIFNPKNEDKLNKPFKGAENILSKAARGMYISDFYDLGNISRKNLFYITNSLYDYSGEIIGFVSFEIDINDVYKRLYRGFNIGDTGEITLGKKISDNKFIFLSPLKYERLGGEEVDFSDKKEILPMQKALSGKSGSGKSLDYRHKKVLSVWGSVRSLGWGFVVKIDEDEAFSRVFKLRNLALIAFSIMILIVVLAAFLIANSISRPIDKLMRGAMILGGGNFDYRIDITSRDEIGEFAHVFNGMAENLKKTTTSIEVLNKEAGEREKAEAALKIEKDNLIAIFASAPVGMLLIDEDYVIVGANIASSSIIGKEPSDIIYHTIGSGIGCVNSYKDEKGCGFSESCAGCQLREVIIKTLNFGISAKGIEMPVKIVNNGRERSAWIRINSEPVVLNNRNHIVVALEDITEHKKAEKVLESAYKQLKDTQNELIQAEKMAAVGHFSSCIAHEVKNPLSILLGGLEYLEAKLASCDGDVKKSLAVSKEAVVRANSILESLLKFARPSDLKTEIVKVKDVVTAVIDMAKEKARLANVLIDSEFLSGLKILADKNQLHQALLNIIMNAIDAMPKGGRIFIKIYKGIVDKLSSDEPSCIIEVKDTGVGIPKENLARLVEPFFTTKERGTGTGLGLFITNMIINNHNGILLVESVEGQGTTMKVVLPVLK